MIENKLLNEILPVLVLILVYFLHKINRQIK